LKQLNNVAQIEALVSTIMTLMVVAIVLIIGVQMIPEASDKTIEGSSWHNSQTVVVEPEPAPVVVEPEPVVTVDSSEDGIDILGILWSLFKELIEEILVSLVVGLWLKNKYQEKHHAQVLQTINERK
jgi:hypothetical protein